MTAVVRIFSHRGIVPLPNIDRKQDAADSVYVLVQPYEARETITAGAVALSSAAATAPTITAALRLEIEDGKTIGYEINPPGRSTAADASSPRLSGKDQFFFGSGWTISVIDMTGVS